MEAHRFQALYIACWIYKPVVKGSYMLRLFDEHTPNVRRAYEKLGSRGTSHLHGPTTWGKDAHKGWRFLRGYHELLVQMEEAQDGTYLFLKCEGHPALSLAHYQSYRHKKRTGQGLDVNPELLTLASDDDRHLGIKVRAAENYGTSYRALMEYLVTRNILKKKGEIVSAREAAARLVNEARNSAAQDETLENWLQAQLGRYGVSTAFEIPITRFEDSNNDTVGRVFSVIARFAEQARNVLGHVWRRDPFLIVLRPAVSDIEGIARQLVKDSRRGNQHTVRFFQEVVVHPYDIDRGLEKAHGLLTLGKE